MSCLLRQALVNFNWGGIIAAIDCGTDSIDNIYNDFINIIKWHINSIVPVRKISMRERDPSYITPRIKILLRKRNKLRRAGKIEEADYIAVKVNPLIAHNRSTALAGSSNADAKQLCGLLKRTGTLGANKQTVFNIYPNQINDYFANIATDHDYDRSAVIKAALRAPHHATNFVKYTRDS